MVILVFNFDGGCARFKLLDMGEEVLELAKGRYEGIGEKDSPYRDVCAVLDVVLKELPEKPEGIGIKAVHGGEFCSAVRVTEEVIRTMEGLAKVSPGQNPDCIKVMRALEGKLPHVPVVAVFDTTFHQTIPRSRQIYAVPYDWAQEKGKGRYGFHGISHQYVSLRVGRLLGKDARRVISCHLGESSSICAIENGKSVANSFARWVEDVHDLERAAGEGDAQAKLAMDALIESVRHHIGAYLVALGGRADVLAFTGSIGESSGVIREAVCRNLEWAGVELDSQKNLARGKEEKISKVESGAEIWIIPSNEELVIAMHAAGVLTAN